MRILRVGCGTVNQTPLDFQGNVQRIMAVIKQAKEQDVGFLLLPELCISGYGCEDQFFSPTIFERAEASLLEIAAACTDIAVVVGLPVRHRGAAYNCAALLQDGRIVGINPKRVLPREGVHYEYRWFRPWAFNKRSEVYIGDMSIPFGDLRYRLGQVRIAIEICEEAWGAVPASAGHAEEVDLVVNPSASHYGLGRYQKRSNLVADSSRALQVAYLYANPVGLEAGRLLYDGGCFVAVDGSFLVKGERFGYRDHDLCYADVDLHKVRSGKMRNRAVRADEGDSVGIEIAGSAVTLRDEIGPPKTTLGKPVACDSDAEEFFWAVTTGLFDYMRKSRSRGFVVSLSGGVDSTTCAVLISHMIAEAKLRLSPEDFARVFAQTGTAKDVISNFLTCMYQGTSNSGQITRAAARAVSAEVGAAFHEIEVHEFVDLYTAQAEKILGRTLTWQDDDITLQNIQARVRGPAAWMVANAKGALLITTSNRSECAVGYATMDGDTVGGLAPIAGIDKKFLRAWLRWAETSCTLGLGPLPSLRLVNEQQPTAELRPPEQKQQDEVDLMPYEILEKIEGYFVRDKLSAADIVGHIEADFPHIERDVLDGHVQTFRRLWKRSQWKRERLAPSFHLDSFSVDPKTWCRYPILSGP